MEKGGRVSAIESSENPVSLPTVWLSTNNDSVAIATNASNEQAQLDVYLPNNEARLNANGIYHCAQMATVTWRSERR